MFDVPDNMNSLKRRHPATPRHATRTPRRFQGENDAHGDVGNSALAEGYGCDQVALAGLWRRAWSEASGTPALAPFGVVSLAAGGSEGANNHIGGLRWSQTGDFGALPNRAMPNTFMAHAYGAKAWWLVVGGWWLVVGGWWLVVVASCWILDA
jgi:hypothetical protein